MDDGSDHGTRNLNKDLRWMNKPVQALPLADAVLRLIWQEHQISRAEIARRLNLSRSTVTEIAKDLLQTSFVDEGAPGVSSGGRRPKMLEFQDEARCILGVDIGASHVSVVLTDLRCRLIKWKRQDHPVWTDPDGTLALVTELCDECLASPGARGMQLLSVGVSVPSPVDPARPEYISETALPKWHGRNAIEHLQNKYGVPVHIDNDANLGALGEQWWGAASGIDNMIFVKLGSGVGAGYILNGEMYRGAEGVAGEIGHLPVDLEGTRLVNLIGSYALKMRVHSLLRAYSESMLADQEVTIGAINKAALAGDVVALRVVREAAEHLGIALTGLVNALNPSMIVVGGGLVALGDLFLQPLREKVQQNTHDSVAASVRIQASVLGPRVVALGASTLALEAAFSAPNFIERATQLAVI